MKLLRYDKKYAEGYNKIGSAIHDFLQVHNKIAAYKMGQTEFVPNFEEEVKVLENLSFCAYKLLQMISKQINKAQERKNVK